MSYEAKVVLDSIARGHRLTTMQVTFPRFILAEFNTHRVFSRNSASSRAIPVERRVEQARQDPFVPSAFGKNQRGMQAGATLDEDLNEKARQLWMRGAREACDIATELAQIGVHKQWANRFVELFSFHVVVVSATEWSNYDALRDSSAASPEIVEITQLMKQARRESTPNALNDDEWHLPYIAIDDFAAANNESSQRLSVLRKVSVGRCAAVSYMRQEEKNFAKDVERYNTLRQNGHMSPFEHVARPMTPYEYDSLFKQKNVVWDAIEWRWVGASPAHDGEWLHYCGNFQGWVQERKMIPNEHDFARIGQSMA